MLAFLILKDDHYKNGKQLGEFGAEAFHHFMAKSPVWHTLLQWLSSPKLRQMAKIIENCYPEYWQELKGLAKGLGVPFEQVLLWNCRGDLWALTPDGCTTVQIPTQDFTITHNEDGDPLFHGHCALAHVCTEHEEFVSFLYPGSILGHTFAVNQHGLAVTVNNLRLQNEEIGVPRMILTRAIISARNISEVSSILRRHSSAGGFHLTIAHARDRQMHSVEFNPYHCSIQEILVPSLHANHMIHQSMLSYPQWITGSSAFRQMIGENLLRQGENPLSILRSQEHPNYPIYRNSDKDSDNENTLATVSLIVKDGCWNWAVYQMQNQKPVMRFCQCILQ